MECSGCGSCCQTFPIFASRSDAEREPRIRAEGYELPAHLGDEEWAYRLHRLAFHTGCCFLDANNRCGIYPTRLQICRDFEAGCKQCAEARGRCGLPPLGTGEGA